MQVSFDNTLDISGVFYLHDVPKGTMPRIVPKDPDSKSYKSYSVFIGNLEIVVFEQGAK